MLKAKMDLNINISLDLEVFKCLLPSLPLHARDLGLFEVFKCFFLHSPCRQEIWFSHTPYARIAGTGYYCAFRNSGSFKYT